MTRMPMVRKCDNCKRTYKYDPIAGRNIRTCPYCFGRGDLKSKILAWTNPKYK